MSDLHTQHANYARIAKAIEFLVDNHLSQPSLAELAKVVGLSEFHMQRVFLDWAGVSPKQFLQFLTKEHAKQALKNSPVLNAALASGLSGSSRLHDLMIKLESISPGEYRRGGEGLSIEFGVHPSRFGHCLVALTPRGVCKLAFFDRAEQRDALIRELHNDWPKAMIEENPGATEAVITRIFGVDEGGGSDLKLLVKGSPFRLQVWEALLKIPEGSLVSYQHIANAIGKPSAVRAVASAVAGNAIGYLIPCHRVIRGSGALSDYRWGSTRKAAVIAWEHAGN